MYATTDLSAARRRPAAMFYYSRDRGGAHPVRHLAGYAGILQADAYGGYNKLYEVDRRPGPIIEAGCWVHARRPFFLLADIEANARRKSRRETACAISALALEAVRRIDKLFEIERSINGDSAERRRAVRQELSPPLIRSGGRSSKDFPFWLTKTTLS
jgi:transposase